MIRHGAALLVAMALFLAAQTARAEEGRFDAQVFRPTAAPRDLVMVQKSEVIGHLSPVLGIYQDLGLDPLVLVSADTGQTIKAVGARLQLTGLVGMGLFDWLDLQLAVPFVAWQTSDNLRPLGTEGPVQSTSLGDLRLSTRVALPYFNRRSDVTRGLGMALTGNINLPTGSEKAFTGDGVLTGGVTLIADYRVGFGAIITANAGLWLRPERQFAGTRIGDMASMGVAAETYVIQSRGLSIVGGVYSYPSLNKFPDDVRQIPAEALLALRWQTKSGITFTVGGSFGAACAFGAPALRFFNGINWQPKTSREQEQINRILERERDDIDGDGLTNDVDMCPYEPGPPENRGCPDVDTDGDGVPDREDECPELPAGPNGKRGCPTAYIEGDEIVILDKVHFATDKDIILDQSLPVLDAVAQVLLAHPELLEVRVEGHTDVRATDSYNLSLSMRRAESVRRYLVEQGIVPERLQAKGYGHTKPLYDDSNCLGPDEKLSEDCRFMTSENRRVVFRILRRVGDDE
jgi:OmpA-OmpF porin, OOP family